MRRELIFYDFDGSCLGRTGELSAVYFKGYYNAVGTFEVHLPLTATTAAEAVLKSDFVIAVGDGFKAIVTQVTANEDELIVYGRTLNWILTWRLVEPFGKIEITDDDGETETETEEREAAELAEEKVRECFGGCMSVKTSGITGHTVAIAKTACTQCGNVVIEALEAAGLGHRVEFSPSEGWSFEVYEGSARSLILSRDLHNATDASLTKDLLDRYNTAYTEGTAAHSDDITDRETEAETEDELTDKNVKRELSATAVGLKLGSDYELGDVIRATEEFCGMRFTSRLRVTGVELWAEQGDEGERPITEVLSE